MTTKALKFVIIGSKSTDDVSNWQKIISRAYPSSIIESTDLNSPYPTADLYIIDTKGVSKSALEFALDNLNNYPCLLLIDSISDYSTYRELIQSRREAVLRADMDGLTPINTLHHLLERQQLHEQLQKLSHYLKDNSTRDNLTKMFNHRHFNLLLDQEVKKANRYKRPLCLLIVSINNLQQIIEQKGISSSDQLVEIIADKIRKTIREVDVAARYSNNEFAILLPETEEDAGARVADRIFASSLDISHYQPILSFGVSGISKNINNANNLLNASLRSLVEAKQNQNGTICTYMELSEGHKLFKEDRETLKDIRNRISVISSESQKNCFNSILRVLSENPFSRKYILPHGERVAFFAEQLAQKEGLSPQSTHAIRRAGILHDIGKIVIDSELFLKEGKLTPSEYSLARQHATLGSELLEDALFLSIEREAIKYHHERYDGNGYPERLAREHIPIEARILSIAEAWDTMTTVQPYRKTPFSFDEAIKIIEAESGHQFDPNLTDKFLNLITS